MHRARRLLFPAVILGLVALAAFGVRQVIVGQEPDQPQVPSSAEEILQIVEAANARSREAIQQFIGSGGQPCSLPLYEALAEITTPYPDLPALVNDVDLVVVGTPLTNVLEPPGPTAGAARILTAVQIDQVLMGAVPSTQIVTASGQRVSLELRELGRIDLFEADLCTPGEVLLFLERTPNPDVFAIGSQGWARLADGAVASATFSHLFQHYPDAQALLDAVRQIAEEQQGQGLPKGLLLCRDKWSPLEVCPGDSFNPYQTFRLDTVNEAYVVTTDPGPSPLAVARTDLEPGSPQLSALLTALDLQVTVQPLDFAPDDLIGLTVLVSPPVGGRDGFLLEYSPSAGIVQMPPYGGQFPAPPAFQQAMEPFLAAPSP